MAPNKPAIFRGAASHWPAIDKWTDEYLRYAQTGHYFEGNPLPQTLNFYPDDQEFLVRGRGDGGCDSERVRGCAVRRQEAVRHAARRSHDHGSLFGYVS